MLKSVAVLHRAMILIQDAIKLLQKENQQREIHDHVLATKRECADTRDRIEHLIERIQALEEKINALTDAEAQRREDIQQAIRQILSKGEF
jgi:Mg2+ and Co2+ transporter CorA